MRGEVREIPGLDSRGSKNFNTLRLRSGQAPGTGDHRVTLRDGRVLRGRCNRRSQIDETQFDETQFDETQFDEAAQTGSV